ncbi:RTA1 like protein-domain-containing protein [Rhizoctonia solani]|nr:RTA1 like protein-domain-containing protein [Rhizoctonia solani]
MVCFQVLKPHNRAKLDKCSPFIFLCSLGFDSFQCAMTVSAISYSIFYLLLSLLAQSLCVFGVDTTNVVNDIDAPLKYTPNITLATVAGSIFAATVVGLLIWSIWYRGYYMVTIITGAIGYALGLFLRIRYTQEPTNPAVYNAMDLFLLLSPSGFIAGVFMMLVPIATYLDAQEFLILKPNILTKIFLVAEFTAFLVQGAGSAMSIALDTETKGLGSKILLSGLILQTVSLTAYMNIFGLFVFRLWKARKDEWRNRPNGILKHWLALLMVVGVGLQNLSIRGGYRMLVTMQGPDGPLSSSEQFFYTAECVTLWGAISAFLTVWPPRYLAMPRPIIAKDVEVQSVASFYSRL